MRDEEFEWDDEKSHSNFIKHGLTFEVAKEAFNDAFALDLMDDRVDYGEDRYNIIAMVEGHILFVAYTEREDRIRIISAREAAPYEQKRYYEENS